MRVHFGLGKTDKIEWIEIRWPSGLIERFADVKVDQIANLIEGKGSAVESRAGKP
jgi:hypothetical protein